MRLNQPSKLFFLISLIFFIVGIVGLLGIVKGLPIDISWSLAISWLVLAAGCILKGV